MDDIDRRGRKGEGGGMYERRRDREWMISTEKGRKGEGG